MSPVTFIRTPIGLYALSIKSPAELGILSLTVSFGKKGLRMSNNKLAALLHVDRRSIIRVINRLKDNGFLVDRTKGKKRRLIASKKVMEAVEKVVTGMSLPELPGSDQSVTSASDRDVTQIVTDLSPIIEGTEDKKKRTHSSLPHGEPKKRRFTQPTPEMVTRYAESIGYCLNGQRFVDHYESVGWKVGRNPMKDWQAVVRTWKQRDEEKIRQDTGCVMTTLLDPAEADRLLREVEYYKET